MNETLVKVEGVSKKYCKDFKQSLWYGVQDITSEMLGRTVNHNELRKDEFWAVKDISFELKRGECLGLMGRNGAGKSTLLKILNGLIKPDQGSVTMKGRVNALIQLGAGFNPILSGRENIYVNGRVLGFTNKEIDEKFDDIVAFAEMDEFLDMPVQNYSSGMKVRLGFAVAAQLEPDVLILDEVLAVGDVGFRVKCFNKLFEFMESAAVILVAHIPQIISRLSTNIMVVEKGKQIFLGKEVGKGIDVYNDLFVQHSANRTKDFTKIIGSNKAEILNIHFESNRDIVDSINYLDDIDLCIKLSIDRSIKFFKIHFAFLDIKLQNIAQVASDKIELQNNPGGEIVVVNSKIERTPFNPGIYSLVIRIFDDKGEVLTGIDNAIKLKVIGEKSLPASVILEAKWSQMTMETGKITF